MRSAAVSLLALTLSLACNQSEAPATKNAAATPAKPAVAPPSSQQALDLIETSAEFSEYEFTNAAYTLPLQRSAMNEPAQQAAADLKKAGWLAFDGSGAVILTPKAKQDRRVLVRANGAVDLVPLARKDVTAVPAVRPQPDGRVLVDFEWKWTPNEIGAAFRSGTVHDRYAAPQKATATLMHDGTNWTVLTIVKRD